MVGENLKIGTSVWHETTWSGICEEKIASPCKVTESGAKYYDLKGVDIVGSSGGVLENLYLTKDEAVAAYKTKADEKVRGYLAQINTIQDLVAFMFNHNVAYCEEYTDYEARKAAEIKAKEFGVEFLL